VLRLEDYKSEIIRKNQYDTLENLSKDSNGNNPVTSLQNKFIDSDKLKNSIDCDLCSVDALAPKYNKLHMIEFKNNISNFPNIKLKFMDSIAILIKSYNDFLNENETQSSYLSYFDSVNFLLVKPRGMIREDEVQWMIILKRMGKIHFSSMKSLNCSVVDSYAFNTFSTCGYV